MPLTLDRIRAREITLAVIGLGYIGFPQALSFAHAGVHVLGFDIDANKIKNINQGQSNFCHVPSSQVAPVVESGFLKATGDFTLIKQCEAVLISVPTPLGAGREPDLSFVTQTCRSIAPHLQEHSLVCLESTSWPGTTRELVLPLLEKHGNHQVGKGLYLCYSPERVDPGNQEYTTSNTPRLIGGIDEVSCSLGSALYGLATNTVIPVSSLEIAESAKILENVFRSVNIALVNELKMIFDRMAIDIWEVIEAASSKPFGFMPFYPGPGLGGHCIPIDPYYLAWKAKQYGVPTRFVELAGEINHHMPTWVVRKVQDALNTRGKPLNGARILVLGVAYKPDVDDLRESPSREIMVQLEEKGAVVHYHDPLVPIISASRRYPSLEGRKSQALAADYDCFVLATHHSQFSAEEILAQGVMVVDTRWQLPTHERVIRA